MKFSFKIISKNISLNLYSKYLTNVLQKYSLKYSVVKLPQKIKRFTLLKSPHVNKKAMEQFQTIEYKILFNIQESNKLMLDRLFLTLIQNKPKFLKIFIRKII